MTSAFGGQHSIQLSYGCSKASRLITAPAGCRKACGTALRKEFVTKLQRLNKRIHFGQGIVQTE